MTSVQQTTGELPADVAEAPRPAGGPGRRLAAGRRVWDRIPAHWKFVLGLYLGAKVVLPLVGLIAIHAFDAYLRLAPADAYRSQTDATKFLMSSHQSISMWFAWDSFLYWRLERASLFAPGP